MKIVFASNNSSKIIELKSLFVDTAFEIIPQSDLSVPDVEENACTFVENALLKARHATELTGLPAIADDSGLEVFALAGKPGIHSRRYAGTHATNQDNINKLLQNLANTPAHQRNARFYSVLVFILNANDPTPLICEGAWYGSVLQAPQGDMGFGYDPIFYLPEEKCSVAELSLVQKNRLSHRSKALRALIEKLPEKIHT